MVKSDDSGIWRQKIGWRMFEYDILFCVIYYLLGQCNHAVVQHGRLGSPVKFQTAKLRIK
jgi:hypothetical protein